jgi:DNA-directed RNA polymerase omega subunit
MDIISLPIEFDEEKIDGRFRLVNIAAQRAKELAAGVEPYIQTKSKKVTTIALEEAIQNKLEFLIGEEAAKAKEEAKKLDIRKLLEMREEEREPEDLTELEKDLQIYMQDKEESISPDEIFDSEE